MGAKASPAVSQADLLSRLERLDDDAFDRLDFGVIGLCRDADAPVRLRLLGGRLCRRATSASSGTTE